MSFLRDDNSDFKYYVDKFWAPSILEIKRFLSESLSSFHWTTGWNVPEESRFYSQCLKTVELTKSL